MMVENTPSYMLASAMLEDDRNGIFFVGYCDPNTPGGRLLECQLGDEFLFEEVDILAQIRASIKKYDLSGHADREELLAFAQSVSPRKIVLHHGDPEARAWFSSEFEKLNLPVLDPEPLIEYEV